MNKQELHIIQHPIIEYYLTILRSKETDTEKFRHTIKKLAALVAYPLSAVIQTIPTEVETPLGVSEGVNLKKQIAFFPILRSGILFSDVISDILPVSFIGPLGIRRNRSSLLPETYYSNMPSDLSSYVCVILDPMLATGGIICKSLELLKSCNANDFIVLSLIATQEGINNIFSKNPEINMMCCHIDPELDIHGYIRPGLGDIGDRAFGATDNAVLGDIYDK